MFASRRIFNLTLALVLVGFGIAGYVALGPPATAKAVTATATVSKGSVLSSVSATGNASAATQLSLSFQTSGTVTEIDVAPGQVVTAGQVLAKITNASQQDALTSAKASLASAQAKYLQDQVVETPQQKAVDATSLQMAQNSVANAVAGITTAQASAAQDATQQAGSVQQAQQNLTTAQATAALDAKQQQTAVDQAQQNVANAQANANQDATTQEIAVNQALGQLQTDQQTYQNDQKRPICSTSSAPSSGGSSTSTPPTTQPNNCVTQSQLDSDNAKISQDQNQVTNAENAQQASALKDSQATASAQNGLANAQNSQAAAALKDAQSVQSAQNAIGTAQTGQQAAALKDQQAVQNAQQQLASAQLSQQSTAANNAVKQAPPTSATMSADQAQLDSAQAQVDTAQTNFNQTVLTAPVGGTVSLITGVVGQQAGSSNSSSSSSGSSSASSSSTSSAGSAGSGFVTLTNLQTLQVVAGFSETDAAKIQLGEPATVTFNALPNQTLQGKVSQIDINSQVVSNVVTYNVTVSIVNPPAALKPGMTANVAVTTAERDAVLTLPSSAVTTTGSTTTLQVQGANGNPVAQIVTIGLRGDTNDEITSGLNVGDKVIITRAATTGTGATNNFRLPAGVGGGIGGAVTGGGGGGAVRAGG